MNGLDKHLISRVRTKHGDDLALALANATGIERFAIACALADARDRDERPTIDDRGDELATRERDDRFAGA